MLITISTVLLTACNEEEIETTINKVTTSTQEAVELVTKTFQIDDPTLQLLQGVKGKLGLTDVEKEKIKTYVTDLEVTQGTKDVIYDLIYGESASGVDAFKNVTNEEIVEGTEILFTLLKERTAEGFQGELETANILVIETLGKFLNHVRPVEKEPTE